MKIKKILIFILGKYYVSFRKFFYFFLIEPIRSIKKIFYNTKHDLEYNKQVFNDLNLDYNDVKKFLKNCKINPDDENLSWHYFIFAGLKIKFDKENKNIGKILEIGTYNGAFTSFLSTTFPNSEIVTIDIAEKEIPYNSKNVLSDKKKFFFDTRRKNINKKNITYKSLNSLYLNQEFQKNSFDLIWIDGDHLNPQVSLDIYQCINLSKEGSIICVDDIIFNDFQTPWTNKDSSKTLSYFEKLNIIKNDYVIKRIRKRNMNEKKFISISNIL